MLSEHPCAISRKGEIVDDSIELLRSPPTRGDNALDLVNTNCTPLVTETWVAPPLETEDGKKSYHASLAIVMNVPKEKDFKWIKKKSRKRTDSADGRFGADMATTAWDLHGGSAEDLVSAFDQKLGTLTDRHFPLRTTRVRSNEDPGITNGIRRRARRKKRIYKEKGKSPAWKKASEDLQEEIQLKKQEFVDSLLGAPDKSFYSAAKRLSGHGARAQWSIMDIFPGETPAAAGKKILDYFANVGGDGTPSKRPHIGPAGDAGLGHLDEMRVIELLKAHHNTNAGVPGDLMVHLVHKFPALFAPPIAAIFNAVNSTATWPERWKK